MKYKYASAEVYQQEFKRWFLKYKLIYYFIIDIVVGYCFRFLNKTNFYFLKTVHVIFYDRK